VIDFLAQTAKSGPDLQLYVVEGNFESQLKKRYQRTDEYSSTF